MIGLTDWIELAKVDYLANSFFPYGVGDRFCASGRIGLNDCPQLSNTSDIVYQESKYKRETRC